MTYTRKTCDTWVIQQHWGYGWEDVTEEETRREGLIQLKCYRENQDAPARLILRRVHIEKES
jgi:hypothetical protein